MTSQTNSRYGFTFALTLAVMVAVAVAGSVWAKGTGQQMGPEATRIDVATVMTSAAIASLPVLHIVDPI